jgi:hypothetical protein
MLGDGLSEHAVEALSRAANAGRVDCRWWIPCAQHTGDRRRARAPCVPEHRSLGSAEKVPRDFKQRPGFLGNGSQPSHRNDVKGQKKVGWEKVPYHSVGVCTKNQPA